MAGGFPLAAVTGRAEVMDAPQVGGLGGTYGGNPLACAAALAVIDAMEAEDLAVRAVRMGEQIRSRFCQWATEHEAIGDVRGLGAMMAVEFVRDRGSKTPNPELTQAVLSAAMRRGLILLAAGTYGNIIRLLAPLTTPEPVLEEGLDVLEQSLKDAAS